VTCTTPYTSQYYRNELEEDALEMYGLYKCPREENREPILQQTRHYRSVIQLVNMKYIDDLYHEI
jgi:hypothetical protein